MKASLQDGTYPRPQLVREDWTSLDGMWEFSFDDDDEGLTQRWFEKDSTYDFPQSIRVPFVPESAESGIGDAGFHSVVWYRTTLTAGLRSRQLSTDRVILHFGAVDHSARVWVDGQLVASHVGGQSAFQADITDALDDSEEHVVVVRAYEDPHDFEYPRGKQDWQAEPHSIWYHRSTGIWRTVWLEQVNRQHVTSLHWTSDFVTGTVSGTLTLALPPRHASIQIEISDGDEVLAEFTVTPKDKRIAFSIELPALRNAQARDNYLWTPEHPNLIDATVRVFQKHEETDAVSSYFGIRGTSVDRGTFRLNGMPYYVRSVLEQGYWPNSHLTAPTVDHLRKEVELIKSLGFNAARIHQKVEDPRFLYWADRLGLLIWGESAAAYEFSPRAVDLLVSEWIRIVDQYRNHPSIVTWVPVNESWGVQDLAVSPAQRHFVQAITSLTRAIDPTRPVISNDGWEHVDSDILSLHDYSSEPAKIVERYGDPAAVARTFAGGGPQSRRAMLTDVQRDKVDDGRAPLMITEFGGVSYDIGGNTWGYTLVDSDDAYRDHLTAIFDAIRECDPITGFCYTQLTDTMQEANGLLTEDRVPKLPIEVLRQIITGEPATAATESPGT
jgi:beta-galactosidase/beta-glucuronidase